MIIAIDIDGVLATHVAAVLERLAEENPSFRASKEEIRSWDEPLPQLDTDVESEILEAQSDPEFLASIPPVDGAVAATNELHRAGHELLIVTHRPSDLLPATHDWLDAHGIPHERERALSTNGGTKGGIEADILIDDYPGHLDDFQATGGRPILFAQPWNECQRGAFENRSDAAVAEDWTDVLRVIEELEPPTASSEP